MTLFEMSVSGAVLIGVILLLRRGLLYHLPKWTFLLLWGVALCRLLVPFRLPSPVSVYTGAAQVVQAIREEAPSAPEETVPLPVTYPGTLREDVWNASRPAAPQEPVPAPVSPLTVVYTAGAALCALFFLRAYGRGLRRFRGAVPAEEEFLTRWQNEHPTLVPVRIKMSAAVNAPLAYGLVRPTILLPEHTDWANEEQLTYVLTHEYVHIRRGDMLWKLLLAGALCLHWCNPLVWAMYFCANRDLELACDEAVVGILGPDRRRGYAFALLSAEEGRFSPLCTTFASNRYMEERIRAIMKFRQKSMAALLTAAVLVAGVTAVFATSQGEITGLPLAVQSDPPPDASAAPAQPEDVKAGDISAGPWEYDIAQPEEGDAAGTVAPVNTSKGRVHPVTGEPAASSQTPVKTNQDPAKTNQAPAEPEQASTANTAARPNYYNLPEDHLHYDACTPNPANFWGLPEDGVIVKDTEYFGHDEEELKEMIRQLRRMGYPYSLGTTIHYDSGKCSVVLDEDYDGVQRELAVPEGIMPDWTYPVNSKGETYGNVWSRYTLGYDPYLVSCVATNGEEGYITTRSLHYTNYPGDDPYPDWEDYRAWLWRQPKVIQVPVYDLNRDNIVGYFEFANEDSNEYTMSQVEFERRLETLEYGLRSSGKRTEEEIARELEKFRQECSKVIPEMTLDELRQAYGW